MFEKGHDFDMAAKLFAETEQDAKASEIYAKAYNQSPESVAFYEFTRTMQSYPTIIAENTTLVLSTDSDLFKFIKGMSPHTPAAQTEQR